MSTRAVTFAGFAVIGVLIVAWAGYSARRAGSLNLPQAVGALTRTTAGRVTMFLFWAWLGLHLFARGSGAFKR
jgi:hypothetical protein